MDRSQVRQFGMNRSIYSSKVMGMSSSILHSPRSNTQRQIHLRKSRIANIPQSKNIDLSQKLDFVVIFQTIQIERMAEEIQAARSRIKQYQRQLFNCDNYQIQIKELTERCYRLESEKNSYREELYDNKRASELIFNELEEVKKRYVTVDFTTNQKYKLQKTRNEQIVFEVEKWKARYNALDESKSKQLQTIKKMMQEQSKSHLSRQTKELFDRFQIQKQQMEQMIRSFKQMNLQKETQLKKCKFQLENKDKIIDQLQRQVDEYEQKVALLSQENYRLSQMSKSKQNEIVKLKDKIKINEQSINRISQQLGIKTQESKKLLLKIKKIQQTTNEKQTKLTKMEKISLNDKERLSQLDRIVFLLKQRENQIQSKNKIIERKDKKIITLQDNIKGLLQNQTSTKQEITNIKQQSLLASQTITNLLKRIQHLTLAIKNVKQSTQTSFTSIQTNNTSFRQEINNKTSQIIDYSHKLMGEIHQNEQYISKLEDTIKTNSQKIETIEKDKLCVLQRLQELKEYQAEYDKLQEENNILIRKMQNIVQENNHLTQKNHQLMQVKDNLMQQKDNLIQQKNNLMQQKNKLMQQKNNLMQQTEMKQQQIMNQTQRQIQIIQEKYQNNIIKNIRQQLLSKDRELNQLKTNLTNVDKKIREMEKQFMKREQQLRKIMDSKQVQSIGKCKAFSKELAQKSQLLLKQLKLTQQLKQSISQLSKFYQSSIKHQLQSLMSRLQPMQNTIRTLKSIISQKLIKQQKLFVQKQQYHQTQITQLININMNLMDKNHQLYDALILTNVIDHKSIDIISSNNHTTTKHVQELQHTTANNTIYTSNGISAKSISSPRNTNQNYNASNIVGVGTKIKDTIKGNFSHQISSSIPLQFLIKHVILCAELQSLRQRIGDKNAKVQKMKNSLMLSNVSSNKSFVAVVNGNTKLANQHIHQPNGEMMLESNLMSSTLINKLNNPFHNSIVGNMNNQTSFIHQSRLIEHTERHSGQDKELNIRRVISEERYPAATSPDNSSILENSQNKNTGIYTNRMSGSGSGIGFGRNGFKSIGIKKTKMYS